MPLNHSSLQAKLTDQQLILVGKIMLEFSNIEFLMGTLLSRLLLTPEFLARTYTDNLAAAKVQEAINNALEIHGYRFGNSIITPDKVQEVKDLNLRIDKIRSYRNKFAHYCWMRHSDSEIFGTQFSGKVSRIDKYTIVMTNSQLDKLYGEAYGIVDDLERCVQSLPELDEREIFEKMRRPR